MILVSRLFPGRQYKTEVWISSSARTELRKFVERSGDGNRFLKKLSECAQWGFETHFGGVLRHEGKGVYRFGIAASKFRLLGFNDVIGFVFIDAFEKGKQKLSGPERNRVKKVADVKDQRNWGRSHE